MLGVQQSWIVMMIFARGIRLIGVGIVIGLLASRYLTRFIASEISGVSSTDLFTFAAVLLDVF